MPTKKRILAEHQRVKTTKRVPIVGERVRAALELKGISAVRAAAELEKRGVKITSQAINNIVAGKVKKTKARVRKELAAVAGAPITSKYLGGEEELKAPPLEVVLSWRGTTVEIGGADSQDLISTENLRSIKAPASGPGLAPAFELASLSLYKEIATSWARDYPTTPIPDSLYPMLRTLMSLGIWRRVLFERAEIGIAGDRETYWKDAGEFAVAMRTALSIALKPWSQERAKPRRVMFSGLKRFLFRSVELSDELYQRETDPKWYFNRRYYHQWGPNWRRILKESVSLAMRNLRRE